MLEEIVEASAVEEEEVHLSLNFICEGPATLRPFPQ